MWALVERLRLLRQAGHDVSVTTFRGYMFEGEQSPTLFEARMAANFPEESTITLYAITGSGTAWNCQGQSCGVHEREGSLEGATMRMALYDGLYRVFDGIFAVGNITVSPPLASAGL